MVHLTCKCLNVNIHIKGNVPFPQNPTEICLSADEASDLFFQSDFAEVILDSSGINKFQTGLCDTRQSGRWTIAMCLNCKMDTHATLSGIGKERVAINLSLESDAAHIKSLMQSEAYSHLYKLLLQPAVDNSSSPSSYELKFHLKNPQLHSAITASREQATNFLCQEQKAMEDRIRAYSEQQYAQYASLQSRINKEKQSLISVLMKVHEKNSIPFDTFPSPPTSPDSSTHPSSESAFERQAISQTVNRFPQRYPNNRVVQFSSEKHPRRKLQSTYSVDSSAIFDMEGIEVEDGPPFSDDEEDTDDSSVIEENSTTNHAQTARQYAASLPITVPMWSNFSHSSGSEEEKPTTPEDPLQIGASIQALAMSMRDGKEMFGDLPRRRLNTGDLVKSRPI